MQTDSLHDSATNREKSRQASAALNDLLAHALMRDFCGRVAVELDVKQGTILRVESIERRYR